MRDADVRHPDGEDFLSRNPKPNRSQPLMSQREQLEHSKFENRDLSIFPVLTNGLVPIFSQGLTCDLFIQFRAEMTRGSFRRLCCLVDLMEGSRLRVCAWVETRDPPGERRDIARVTSGIDRLRPSFTPRKGDPFRSRSIARSAGITQTGSLRAMFAGRRPGRQIRPDGRGPVFNGRGKQTEWELSTIDHERASSIPLIKRGSHPLELQHTCTAWTDVCRIHLKLSGRVPSAFG